MREAEDAYRQSLVEPSAFRKLERRRARRAAWTRGVGVTATAAVVALLVFATRPRATTVYAPAAAEAFRNVSVTTVREETVTPPAPAATAAATEIIAVPAAPTAPAPTFHREVEAPSEQSCGELARARKHDRALTCFRALAQGGGVDAELALYKAARLFSDELGEPLRGATLLDDYRARFPSGAMRGEADWLRVQSLARAKRFESALAESETLLGTPAGRALSAELHLLRGRIYDDQLRDCAKANSEYVALLKDPRPLGDEAEFRRAACLEKLGRSSEARAAFEDYLTRQGPLREREAREHLTPRADADHTETQGER